MKTILYKTGLFLIILAWVIYVISFLILLIPGSILRLFGVKLLHSYAFKFNRWMKQIDNKLKFWYINKKIHEKLSYYRKFPIIWKLKNNIK